MKKPYSIDRIQSAINEAAEKESCSVRALNVLQRALDELNERRQRDAAQHIDTTKLDELSDDVLYVTLAVHLIELWQGRPGDPKTLAALVTAGCGRATEKANQAEQLCLKLYDRMMWVAERSKRDPGVLTPEEMKALEDMRRRWKP